MLWHIIVPLAIVSMLIASYIVFLYASAVLETKDSPREPMWECQKHGLIRRKHLIHFLTDEKGTPYEYCPLCFSEKMKTPLDMSVFPK